MRIVFIGTVKMSAALLQQCIALGADIAGVVCKAATTFHSDFADLAPVAAAARIPVHQTMSVRRPETRNWIRARQPDVVFCFGWSELLDDDLLSIAPRGIIGYHPALLPRNRGRHPIVWALALGLEMTGSTFFRMGLGPDDGPILSQRSLAIGPTTNATDLYDMLTDTACDQLAELLSGLSDGSMPGMPQDETAATYWRKRSAVDGQLDWRMPTQGIVNLVRALAPPYPGATFRVAGHDCIVWQAQAAASPPRDIEPGRILDRRNGILVVKTGDGAVQLTKIAGPIDALTVGDCL